MFGLSRTRKQRDTKNISQLIIEYTGEYTEKIKIYNNKAKLIGAPIKVVPNFVIDISNFRFNSAVSLECMFSNCKCLRDIQMPKTGGSPNLEDITHMFYCCFSISHIDTSVLKSNKIKVMKGAFRDCENLLELNLDGLDCGNGMIDLTSMLFGCRSLQSFSMKNFKPSKKQSVLLTGMMLSCKNLRRIEISRELQDHIDFTLQG